MEAPSLQQLESLKYSELQKLAKRAGCKANLKADRLLKALKKHFHPAAMTEKMSDVNNDEKDAKEAVNSVSTSKQRKTQRTEDEIPDELIETTEITAKTQTVNPRINAPPGGKIPRYTGHLSKSVSKPSTPNFKKLHEAHFRNMESIDKYMERKQKRLDAVSSSIQEVKKSLHNRVHLRSPALRVGDLPPAKTPASRKRSACSSAASRNILVDKFGFKPSVFSSTKMNVRFSEATKDNEHKGSLIKTPSRKSSSFVLLTPSSELKRSIPLNRGNVLEPDSENNLSVTTPIKFTAQTIATPNTNKQLKFDLQASLTRPLGYQPHKGKLKPWGEAKENTAGLKDNVCILKNTYKQPPRPTRDDRRKQREKDRKSKRDKTVGTRRGIVIP